MSMRVEDLYGPKTEFGKLIHTKYRAPEENYDDYCVRYSRATASNEKHFRKTLRYTRSQVLLPAGRQQLAVGRPFQTTAMNCYCGGIVEDSIVGICNEFTNGMLTLRTGGGIGWDFSSLRPSGEKVRGLGVGATATGPVSFMQIWNSGCKTIMSSGHRRGAMMAILRVDHPDILKFVNSKRDEGSLTCFNISVAITDEFMEALETKSTYKLKFGGTKFGDARAEDVWSRIMENNWDWAEPGLIFIDRINQQNPLYYCEKIISTNPCAEQPLPPYGACLLGSVNIVKLLTPSSVNSVPKLVEYDKPTRNYEIDFDLLDDVVETMVMCNDNVIDISYYPLEQQKQEQLNKRRMGIGVTGMANALEIMEMPYASNSYLIMQDKILNRIRNHAYYVSCMLAKEKGPFPLFDAEKYSKGYVFERLPDDLQDLIMKYGLRNSHLTSIAPTGTISMAADNVSSGIEPVFSLKSNRTINLPEGVKDYEVVDYAYEFYDVKGRTSDQIRPIEHIDVLCNAQQFVDSSVSKTCNVKGQISGQGEGITFDEFKELFVKAWIGGAKGFTTFNVNGKRAGIMQAVEEGISKQEESSACFIDMATGRKSCDF